MLEKIGLPAKPSLRGNNWVVDASHCQGCPSQFTFINRKHHCRRCGGLFCNSCTQQRMVLRGQGDSPVRICEPCKKLEEAARFEMRYGHKGRAGKGGSKYTVKREDELLSEILGSEGKLSGSSRSASASDMHSSTSFSSSQEVSSHNDREDVFKSLFDDQVVDVSKVATITPEELHKQALEEKKKYRTLKAEGKSEEALRAFKRGKELERQAGALEISLRKTRRKALSSHSNHELSSAKSNSKEPTGESELLPSKSKVKDDVAAELRELGWSDMDLRDADKKPATMSLEGELSTLIGEVLQNTNREKKIHGIDKSQVIAHKKKALELKREGKLAEAKEELKKAKVLEKQIEEQELLGDDDDSDEEFSSLLRSLNDHKQDLSSEHNMDRSFEFGNLVGLTDNIGLDSNLDVTEEDMDDPEMAAALKSLGWSEEASHAVELEIRREPNNPELLLNEIPSLKREALHQKRAGNTEEALALLKKAKLLEKDLDSSEPKDKSNTMTQSSVAVQEVSFSQSGRESVNFSNLDVRYVDDKKEQSSKRGSKSKSLIQKELLGLKKRALALRREGKMDEAEEELKKGRILEKQLEEMDSAPPITQTSFSNKKVDPTARVDVGDEGEEVTDQDLSDPTYLSILKNLGWEDESNEDVQGISSKEEETTAAASKANTNLQDMAPRKSKGEIQRELLGLKRKSLALRRQGEAEEAEEVLKMAKVLEAQLTEIEAPVHMEVPAEPTVPMENSFSKTSVENSNSSFQLDSKSATVEGSSGAGSATPGRPDDIDGAIEQANINISNSVQAHVSQNHENSLQQDILAHKRRALALKREGKLAEAKEELRQAKLLEKSMEEDNSQKKFLEIGVEVNNSQPSTSSLDLICSHVSSARRKVTSPSSGPKTLSSRDRFKIQQESLSHKRQALKLRREGRTEEADAELELARALEAQLEDSTSSAAEPADDVTVEEFLDPQLLSALKAIGIGDANSGSLAASEVHEPKEQVAAKIDKSVEERRQLEEQIKAERIKAVNFKRSGKQAEALDALRQAKILEKKLKSLAPP